jgi:NADH:ubiquinone oxidoreductase subunit B-like Fe-S oxidoreductase
MDFKNEGTFVPGCPPNNIWVVKGVVGERAEVERRYATEEGAND